MLNHTRSFDRVWALQQPTFVSRIDVGDPDRAKIAGGQDHEVRYTAGKTGVSKSEVNAAIKSVGNSRKKVEDRLNSK